MSSPEQEDVALGVPPVPAESVRDEPAEANAAAAGLVAGLLEGRRSGTDDETADAAEEAMSMDELPLWVEEPAVGQPEGRPAAGAVDLPDLGAQLREVAQAWQETVPDGRGTADDLRAVLEADVEALHVRWENVASLPDGAEPTAAAAPGRADARSAATAVDAALRDADRHAESLTGVPEWQQVRIVRDAVSRLWHTLAERAGESAGRLLGDQRVSEFLRTVSVRACETIARLAQLAADRLRRDRVALPSAEALLALGAAAGVYSRSVRRSNGLPAAEALLVLGGGPRQEEAPTRSAAEVDAPGLVAMGRALRRPGPAIQLSATAARLRSGSPAQGRRGAPAAEQPAHLTPGVAEQRGRKPHQR
ncbi:hypothetical protein ACIQOW_10165 [Kitasatospora sp. NPDC091335]|uniref:hypothetical protein n=1 Tax=Kitasatospora sp. NPDC091335 TaxID=3364085 RepID=UPI0037F10D60